MVGKLMALSALTFVTGIVTSLTVGGCSNSDHPGSGSQSDASPDVQADVVKPDGGGGDDEDAGQCPRNVPLTAADLDEKIGWKPAKAAPGACSQADITKLEANFKDTNIKTYFDLGSGLADTCKSCVFAKDTDASWGPIVGTAADDGATGFVNFGACFGSVEGDACGNAVQYEQFCYDVACNACPVTDDCGRAAREGMCKSFVDATGTACPKIQDTAKSCSTVFDAVRTLCGAPGDGG